MSSTVTYTHLAQRLKPLGLAYLNVGDGSGDSRGTAPPFNLVDLFRSVYTGTLLAFGGFTRTSGQLALESDRADLIVYGRPFIANPDLVERFQFDAPLSVGDVRTYYGGDDHGYTDYPTLAEQGGAETSP